MTLAAPDAGLDGAVPAVRILAGRCVGCLECVERCPTGALSLDADRWLATADSGACVGCRQCVRTCRFSAVVVTGPAVVAEQVQPSGPRRGEAAPGFSCLEEAQAEAARCLSCPEPACVAACPARNDVPGLVAAVHEGDLAMAHQVLRATTMLADWASFLCDPSCRCEGACAWALVGEAPVAIGRIEGYVADSLALPPPSVAARPEALSVAVLGSGPAGVGAAWALVEAGAAVTCYEGSASLGGRAGQALPQGVLARPFAQLVEAGMTLGRSAPNGAEGLAALLADHDAVVLADEGPAQEEPWSAPTGPAEAAGGPQRSWRTADLDGLGMVEAMVEGRELAVRLLAAWAG